MLVGPDTVSPSPITQSKLVAASPINSTSSNKSVLTLFYGNAPAEIIQNKFGLPVVNFDAASLRHTVLEHVVFLALRREFLT